MGYIVKPIASLIEGTFPILPAIGDTVNVLLCVVGAIATAIWIGLMVKYEKTEVPNRA